MANKNRTAPELIKCVEDLREEASCDGVLFRIVEVPDDVNWYIGCYTSECVEEVHRTWS